jgi:peptidoglycan/LPS O-acetylase OafA/YrhL
MKALAKEDSEFLKVLRALSTLMIIFGHVGGFWFYRPWSELLQVFVPVFFFISGALFYYSYSANRSCLGFISKRLVQLFVPYYLIAAFSLIVYVAVNGGLPGLSYSNLLDWLTISPKKDIMPFPLGQVWFLHALAIISFAAPLFYYLYEKKRGYLYAFGAAQLLIAVLQLNGDVAGNFIVLGHNFFKPLMHSLFFWLGFVVLNSPVLRKPKTMAAIIAGTFVLDVWLAWFLKLDPDYALHAYSPDIFYVTGSLCAIWLLLAARPLFLAALEDYKVLKIAVEYVHKHIFAFFLIHSFAIYFLEEAFGLSHPTNNVALYGIVKLVAVLLLTALLSPPFTFASRKISGLILARITPGLEGSRV